MTTNLSEEEWIINGFIPFVDLAKSYFPNSTTPQVAARKLRDHIKKEKLLLTELEKHAYSNKTTTLSPKQQRVILTFLGIPQINLKFKDNLVKTDF